MVILLIRDTLRSVDNLHYEKFSDGTIKCIEDEIPFDVPEGWAWTRIQNIAQFQGGFAYKSSKYVEKSNNIIIRMGNIKNNELNPQIATKYISNEYALETASYKIRPNDILFTMTGTRGKRDYFYSCLVSLKESEDMHLYLNQRVGCLRVFNIDCIFPNFFLIALQSRFVLDAIFKTETGNVSQGNISSAATLNLLVPILPVNEQKGIINKINLLFAIIKNIEINKVSLNDNVISVKSKILDLAIHGKLVPQNPDDEPASVLLKRIHAEKEELIKQGKIKRNKKEAVIFKGDDNSYYQDLPETWELVNFKDCATLISGRDLSKDEYNSDSIGIPYITGASNFINGNIQINRWTPAPKTISTRNDILITCKGTIGELAINKYGEIHIARQIMAIRVCKNINLEYIKLFLESIIIEIKNAANGLIPGISRDNMLSLNIPIPPLAEQKRIVEATKKIFTKLDEITTNQVA